MAQPPLLTITAEPLDLMALTPLLREGVLIDLSPGLSLRQTMIQDLGFCPECVEERVQTVFLDGSPVDDIDADSAAPGCTLALAGALPGVAGIAMRRGSPVGAFRQGITHVPTAAKGVEAFQVTLKLFNSVALECLPVVLEQGIITTAQRLAELLASDADVLSHAAFKLGGKLVDRAALLDALRTLGGSLRLEAETVPRSKSKEPLSPPERALLPDDMEALAAIAEAAGGAIMEVRRNGFSVEYKQDHSPLTQADLAAHRVIMHGLEQHFPGVPVLSEEGAGIPYEERAQWRQMFIVDPLDGTKEFVKELGEFCVCIALAEGGYPVLGAVHVPVWGATYVGGLGRGCYKRERGTEWGSITVRQPDENAGLIVLASRSHPSPATEAWLADKNVRERITAGSALKFCLVAEGKADLYPRFNLTREWDTAAGQAIVEGAGGSMRVISPEHPQGGPRQPVNKPDLLNGSFIVSARPMEDPKSAGTSL